MILNLDYPEFNLDSPKGLALIITGFKSVSRDPFPLETIYLGWSSTSSQLSLLKQAIKGSPEFSIAQFPLCSMQLSDELKANLNSEDARTWYVPYLPVMLFLYDFKWVGGIGILLKRVSCYN